MSIRDWLIVGCLLLIVFALGCWVGEHDKNGKSRNYRNTFDPRDKQSAWDRIWRV